MRRCGWPLAVLLSVVLTACSVPPEEPIVSDFFAASRLRDTTALARFSTVVFEPRQRGVVARFHIEHVSPERASGQTRIKDVTVRASIRDDSGRSTERELTITLEKSTHGEKRAMYDGWIVTGFSEPGEGRAAPRS